MRNDTVPVENYPLKSIKPAELDAWDKRHKSDFWALAFRNLRCLWRKRGSPGSGAGSCLKLFTVSEWNLRSRFRPCRWNFVALWLKAALAWDFPLSKRDLFRSMVR